jgi:hypothetical protein
MRSTTFSSMARRSFPCAARGSSPISSRKMVPPAASSNLPGRRSVAPVNDPFSCPNSSDSMSVSGMAAQLTATSARSRRGERWWSARAKSSFPVPDSPRRRTVVSVEATRCVSATARRMASLSPTMRGKP